MEIRSEIVSEIQRIALQQRKTLRPLTDEVGLLECGLDSLCLAILVAALDDRLDLDPFGDDTQVPFPVTLGDFIRLYEHAAA